MYLGFQISFQAHMLSLYFKDAISFIGRTYSRIEGEANKRLLELHQLRSHFSQVCQQIML